MSHPIQNVTCAICGKVSPDRQMVSSELIREGIAGIIQREQPQWSATSFICTADLARFRSQYGYALLEAEKGELTSLENEVLSSLKEHEIFSLNVEADLERKWTFGERLAVFGGSWTFLVVSFVFLVTWIAVNSIALLWRPVDPYPFIFLNLILSCLAVVQAPVIMMSKNRQEAKDRLRSQHDYKINLKAELEIRQLHE